MITNQVIIVLIFIGVALEKQIEIDTIDSNIKESHE